MNNALSLLKSRVKAQLAAARQQMPGQHDDNMISEQFQGRDEIENVLKRKEEEKRLQKMREIQEAENILPTAEFEHTIAKQVDDQIIDTWSRIVSEFKRQLDSSEDLRILLADSEILDERDTDDSTVKFFKGILNEWRCRLFSLPDEELKQKRNELDIMWFTTFALQPYFNGMNERSLTRDISMYTKSIAEALRKLDFREALDGYNKLAIGKSLWPIGVTQFQIHWKFASDLVDSDRVLHLFNNEPARNAIISIRRLMTKYEEFHNMPIPI